MADKLKTWFPHAVEPIIISAPMLGVSNGTLAAEVSKAGGIGMIPGAFDFSPSSKQLATLDEELAIARRILHPPGQPCLPPSSTPSNPPGDPGAFLEVGVGFILCHPTLPSFLPSTLPLLHRHRPRAVWLFAPHPDLEAGLISRIITALHDLGMVVFFQVGTVSDARQAVLDGADVIVAQGVDAGGHQVARGAGVVSLVPEVVDLVDREGGLGGKGVVVVGAGGVCDGRGVAGVLALGAEAMVMGTRFLLAHEAATPEFGRQLIKETQDGGISTIKSTVHDDFQNTAIWPDMYDGRAIVGESYRDHMAGLSIEENIQRFNEAKIEGEVSRMVTWAGTGVGLVREEAAAGEIVRRTREDAKERIRRLQSIL